jgi:hypothetical protein
MSAVTVTLAVAVILLLIDKFRNRRMPPNSQPPSSPTTPSDNPQASEPMRSADTGPDSLKADNGILHIDLPEDLATLPTDQQQSPEPAPPAPPTESPMGPDNS